MIDFIIYEKEEKNYQIIKTIIEKAMIKYDIEYSITNQTEEEKDNFKVYIIDNNEKESLKEAINIREIKDDWQSMIILLADYKNKEKILNRRLMILDIIEKEENWADRFYQAIQISIKNYDKRPNSLKYIYKKVIYNIEFQKIIYIEKEQDNKRCIIKTKDNEYYIQGSLNKIETLLDKRFIKCNRSYIINVEQVLSYNTKENIITFKNKKELYGISREKKKSIINYLRGIDL